MQWQSPEETKLGQYLISSQMVLETLCWLVAALHAVGTMHACGCTQPVPDGYTCHVSLVCFSKATDGRRFVSQSSCQHSWELFPAWRLTPRDAQAHMRMAHHQTCLRSSASSSAAIASSCCSLPTSASRLFTDACWALSASCSAVMSKFGVTVTHVYYGTLPLLKQELASKCVRLVLMVIVTTSESIFQQAVVLKKVSATAR